MSDGTPPAPPPAPPVDEAGPGGPAPPDERAELEQLTDGLRGLLLWQQETGVCWVAAGEPVGLPPARVELPTPAPAAPRATPVPRAGATPAATSGNVGSAAAPAATRPLPRRPESLAELRQSITGCQRCGRRLVHPPQLWGQGPDQPRLLFVSETSAGDEGHGSSLSGLAGELFDTILHNAMGLERQDVFVTHLVHCRGEGDAEPAAAEVAACLEHLRTQLAILRPPAILALGPAAARALTGRNEPLARLRGVWHQFAQVPLRVSYHPGYLVDHPEFKAAAWADIKEVLARLGLRRPPAKKTT